MLYFLVIFSGMNCAFISTFYNEENTIIPFLDSLMQQTKPPSEIVLVDAYSKDSTYRKVSSWIKSNRLEKKISLLRKKGNRSVGRNFAIKNSNNRIITCSDAGCILDRKWVEKILEPFSQKNIDVVAGFYKPITKSPFQKCIAAYTCVPEKKVTNDFLPSSRSIAFKKEAWKKVNGYPEELDTCEDLVFARNLKKSGFKFHVQKKAVVYWPQQENIINAFKQFFGYAKGDGQALYIRPQTPLLFLRFVLGFILLVLSFGSGNTITILLVSILFLLYLVWSIQKNYQVARSPYSFIFLPLLQITSDIAVLLGMLVGFAGRLRKL